jgi:hypothetical protein
VKVRVLDVFKSGTKDPFVVVNVNDCRAACVPLRGRQWDNPAAVIDAAEPTFGISPNIEVGDHVRHLGMFKGEVAKRVSMRFDRNARENAETILIPQPGFNPKQKRSRGRALSTAITDEGAEPTEISPPKANNVIQLLQGAATRLTTILNGPSASPDHQAKA